MLKVSQLESIREQWSDGKCYNEIAKALSIDHKTVKKYVEMDDFSPKPYVPIPRGSKLDPYKPEIDRMLQEERSWFHKQRHTAKRIREILIANHPEDKEVFSYTLVQRYVGEQRRKMKRENATSGGTSPLSWHPGEAQADFGECDAIVDGAMARVKYLNLSFPYSNRVFTVYSEGENCECVCSCLQQIFAFIGKVPARIVFDNATGIGQRIFGMMKETELFVRFRLHYGFRSAFTNVRAGWEKGNVENSIGAVRRNMMVPPMTVTRPFSAFNEKEMLPRSSEFRAEDIHYRKGEAIGTLFMEDLASMEDMNSNEFRVERYDYVTASMTGSVRLEGRHEYCLGPACSGARLMVGRTHDRVNFYTLEFRLIKSFDRLYGSETTVSYDLEAILKGLAGKPNSWMNSPVRDAMEDSNFRRYLDSCDAKERRSILIAFNRNVEEFGFANTCLAASTLSKDGRIPTKEDLASFSRRLSTFALDESSNPTGVDLCRFDALLGLREAN